MELRSYLTRTQLAVLFVFCILLVNNVEKASSISATVTSSTVRKNLRFTEDSIKDSGDHYYGQQQQQQLLQHQRRRQGRLLSAKVTADDGDCEQVSDDSLSEILGPAYNLRYMSIHPPATEDEGGGDTDLLAGGRKRGTSEDDDAAGDFFVDDTYAHELSDLPAWEVDHAALGRGRRKRQAEEREKKEIAGPGGRLGSGVKMKRPWECEARIKWMDLGTDYFPRYLRTVECAKQQCFYGRFTCQPRSFTVKLLRRRKGHCVPLAHRRKLELMPRGQRELWVWEERAVNFCCDCAVAPQGVSSFLLNY